MNKIVLFSLVCMGFVSVMPSKVNAAGLAQVSQNLAGETNVLVAQYQRNQNRDRQFSVYYRNRRDPQWTLEGSHTDRRDAQRAANRLERRGYKTYVQVSREANRGMMNRGMMDRDMQRR
jgi:hypothetical protein